MLWIYSGFINGVFHMPQFLKKSLCVLLLLNATSVFAAGRFGYESGEHLAAGETVKLYFSPQDEGQKNYTFHLANGLELTYGQMVTLAGDFYGVVGQTISEGTTLEARQANFIAAYNTLASDAAAVTEVPKLYAVVERERDALNEGMKNGEKPEAIYARISDDDNRQWNCITGGSCAQNVWWLSQGRYLNLAKKDFDHFGDNAWIAYQAGHQLAIKVAIEAHQSQDAKKLEYAYSLNAYANHFLSDRFASGHIRTPRPKLADSVTPAVIGSVLASFMHKEENRAGLHVHNQRGDHWVAYGDGYFFDAINATNRSIMEEALQKSVNEVFYAYQYGAAPIEETVANLIPQADEMNNLAQQDISPLFYWDSATNTLYRRSDVTNQHDNHWISDWWGWTTLILMASNYGIPTEAQQEIIAAGYGNEAMSYGLIEDKKLVTYVKQAK